MQRGVGLVRADVLADRPMVRSDDPMLDRTRERARALDLVLDDRVQRAPSPRPSPPGERPSAWERRDAVEAYYDRAPLRHAPSFY